MATTLKKELSELSSLSTRLQEFEEREDVRMYLEFKRATEEKQKFIKDIMLSKEIDEAHTPQFRFSLISQRKIDYAGLVGFLQDRGDVDQTLLDRFTDTKIIARCDKIKNKDISSTL